MKNRFKINSCPFVFLCGALLGAAAFLQAASPKIGSETLNAMLERLPESSGARFLREEVAWLC